MKTSTLFPTLALAAVVALAGCSEPAAEEAPASAAPVAATSATEDPVRLAGGSFEGASGHAVEGTATAYRLSDGSRVLRLEDFESDNGPDLKVWLVKTASADGEAILEAGHASLGALKGNQGNQNYDLPAELDLDQYEAVSIWCERFSVNFGTAPLQ